MYNEEYITPIEEDVNFDMLFEAPGDDDAGGGDAENVDLAADDQGNDNTDDAGDQNTDNNADQNQDNQDNNQNNDNQQANDDNFDIDDNDGDDQPDDMGGGEEATSADNTEENAENEVTDAEKDINQEIDSIYNDLTPAEKSRKDLELRSQYKNLYYSIRSLISDTEKFPNTAQNKNISERLLKNLRDFNKYIVYYISNIYDTKSHLENKTKYFEFIQIFNGIKLIFDDLSAAMSHNNSNIEEK